MSAKRSRKRPTLGASIAAVCALASLACGPTPPAASLADGAAPPIAVVHRHQCGRCHSPPEPGSHTRPQLGDAFSRHKNRVHLTSDQWTAMVDYLAAPDASATLHKR